MKKAPKSLRLHIGLFGRTNVGKSSFLNLVANQDVAITSPIPGTTTDVVEKVMELLPLGPVVFLDTAGIDDVSSISELRIKKTKNIFDRADIILLLIEANIWEKYEDIILQEAEKRNTPFIIVVNKIDLKSASLEFIERLKDKTERIILCSSTDFGNRDIYVNKLKKYLIKICPADFLNPPPIIGDLIHSGGLAVLIVPIDLEAPKGRIILPQVQTIRDALDNDAAALIVKEREYPHVLNNLKKPPDISVCDSQVVLKMVADTPKDVKCTTFSILFARYKGDLIEAVKGVCEIDKLVNGDKVLIEEACSHHPVQDDIGRVKIPRWLREYLGINLNIDVYSGHDYPENLKDYKLIIHCGGCMINRREMLFRVQRAKREGVSITNYGVCISFLHGVLERVLSPFPAALDVFRQEISKTKGAKECVQK
ncbi:[FeFe] hydrogenase H-cluster maturation GTPase HydF [bacterium]|nr:[FeFe] hydrogenase H-cluster maturation GTPase HydF [bacterium]